MSTTSIPGTGCCDHSWKMVGIADFNRDGFLDILWQHPTASKPAIWYMNGSGGLLATVLLETGLSDTNWRIVGVGLFDQDQIPDIVFQYREGTPYAWNTGIWYMTDPDNPTPYTKGTKLREARGGAQGTFAYSVDPHWRMVAVAKMDNDTIPSILLRHTGTGQWGIWHMGGTMGSGSEIVTPALWMWNGGAFYSDDLDFTLVGTGDFNADGHIDVFMRDAVAGFGGYWHMNRDNFIFGLWPQPNEYNTDWRVATQPMEESLFRVTNSTKLRVSATVQSSPPAITLNVNHPTDGFQLFVQRREVGSMWGPPQGPLPPLPPFTDTTVSVGHRYEYAVTYRPLILAPPADPSVANVNNTAVVSWSGGEAGTAHVYRAATSAGPFHRLTTSPSASPFTDTSPSEAEKVYLVRAAASASSGCGTFQKLSQGLIRTRPWNSRATGWFPREATMAPEMHPD